MSKLFDKRAECIRSSLLALSKEIDLVLFDMEEREKADIKRVEQLNEHYLEIRQLRNLCMLMVETVECERHDGRKCVLYEECHKPGSVGCLYIERLRVLGVLGVSE